MWCSDRRVTTEPSMIRPMLVGHDEQDVRGGIPGHKIARLNLASRAWGFLIS